MPEDAVIVILRNIQAELAALPGLTADVAGLRQLLTAIDRKFTREFEIVKQDIRMIRSTIHDMGETRVTEGEIAVLHEDFGRVETRLSNLEMRVEQLEGHRTD